MKKIDYSFLKEEYLPPSLLIYSGHIEASAGSCRANKRQYPQLFDELSKIARVQSVKGSNAIEGIVTTDDRIRSIVAGDVAPANHSEEEIAGYRDALDLIHSKQESIPFDEDTIREIHALMMQRSGDEEAGEYKSEDNYISEERVDGSRTIRFRPASADDTPGLMGQLILAYDKASGDPQISKLLLIPSVILDFLCIHPFTDGNGRLSRLLSLLLLYRHGYDACRYVSLEQRINDTRAEYYEALRKSSEKWHDNKNDYVPFIEYTLRLLSDCYSELDSRLVVIEGKKMTKAERIERCVVSSPVPVSKRDICDRLPDVSPTTVEATLAKLLKEEIIEKQGRGRSTKYIRKR